MIEPKTLKKKPEYKIVCSVCGKSEIPIYVGQYNNKSGHRCKKCFLEKRKNLEVWIKKYSKQYNE